MKHTPLPKDYLQEWVTIQEFTMTIPHGVFIPRPETERWVEAAIIKYREAIKNVTTIVDLCSGSGIISMMLAKEFPHLTIYSLDINPLAIQAQQKNIEKNKLPNIVPIQSDLFVQLPPDITKKPWILFGNPPYVPDTDKQFVIENNIEHEPDIAIFGGGKSGLDVYKKILTQLKTLYPPKLLIFELDPRNILLATKILKKELQPTTIHHWSDVNGWHRTLIAEWGNN